MAVGERSLVAELDAARDAFLEALGLVDAVLVTAPGVVGEWSVRDLVVHVAAWCDHATAALDLARDGRGPEFAYSTGDTDAMNERIAAEARKVDPAEALRREASAFAAFRERVAGLPDDLLALRLGNGDTVEEVIRYDGPDHYAEHTEHLRAWFGAGDEDD
jgi:hypothetical protein